MLVNRNIACTYKCIGRSRSTQWYTNIIGQSPLSTTISKKCTSNYCVQQQYSGCCSVHYYSSGIVQIESACTCGSRSGSTSDIIKYCCPAPQCNLYIMNMHNKSSVHNRIAAAALFWYVVPVPVPFRFSCLYLFLLLFHALSLSVIWLVDKKNGAYPCQVDPQKDYFTTFTCKSLQE